MLRGHEVLLVDGYNVTNDWVKIGYLKAGELEFMRQQLVTLLCSVAEFWGIQCIIVFDAHLVKENRGSKKQVSSSVTVVFTPEFKTADSIIESMVMELAQTDQSVLVCSSDRDEQNMILAQGASRISAREFLIEVKGAQQEINNVFNRHPPTSQRSWLEDTLPVDVRKALEKIRGQK